MENKTVIFDTNAYRYFGRFKNENPKNFEIFIRNERALKNVPYLSVIVGLELSNHLSDKLDPHYLDCINALSVIFYHCSDSKMEKLRFIPSKSIVIADVLGIPVMDNNSFMLGQLSLMRQVTNICECIEKDQQFDDTLLISLSEKWEEAEQDFKDNFRDFVNEFQLRMQDAKFINKSLRKSKKKIAPELQRSIVINEIDKTLKLFGHTFSNQEWEFACKKFCDEFSSGVYFFQHLVNMHIDKEMVFSKKDDINFGNNLWDLDILMSLASNQGIDDCSILLVTAEKKIRGVANLPNSDIVCVSPEGYLLYVLNSLPPLS